MCPALLLNAFRKKSREQQANYSLTYHFDPQAQILNLETCDRLCSFLQFMWVVTSGAEENRVDMRICINDEEFMALVGEGGGQMVRSLRNEFASVPGSSTDPRNSKLAFRMTRGPTNACINFHCDGGYATATVQVALNDPALYKGGRLCFFANDTLRVLERPVGSVTRHPAKVLHGVTSLTEGTRLSLFVVDRSNGLGERAVLTVTPEHVQEFLRLSGEQKPICMVCMDKPPSHVILPCGHMCLCETCIERCDQCPICRQPAWKKQKIYM